jgi:hypothetical protein
MGLIGTSQRFGEPEEITAFLATGALTRLPRRSEGRNPV